MSSARGALAALRDLVDERAPALDVASMDDDVIALCGQPPGHLAAEAVGRARDHHDALAIGDRHAAAWLRERETRHQGQHQQGGRRTQHGPGSHGHRVPPRASYQDAMRHTPYAIRLTPWVR
jgi:hypothetical protein